MYKTWTSGLAIINNFIHMSGQYYVHDARVHLDEGQVLKCITKVSNKTAPRYTFYGYTVDDIKQESFFICRDALERYDSRKPLENFLSINLSNRLKNFVRDNHYTSTDDEGRIKIAQPAQLENENTIVEYMDDDHRLDYEDMAAVINARLPANMRFDYLKMINDVYITKGRKEEIMRNIEKILDDHGYFDGEEE